MGPREPKVTEVLARVLLHFRQGHQHLARLGMNIIYRFRLTKVLYDQVRFSRQEIGVALRTWEDREYRQLCDYVSQCRKVVPKYVQRLADLMGVDARDVVADIMHGRTMPPEGAGSDGAKDFGGVYLPEDTSDRLHYIDQITGGTHRRYM